jgi:DNA transformation protein
MKSKAKQNDDQGLTTHVLDLLAAWCEVEPRRMFSGVGLFAFGRMFAIIFEETLYLKDTKDAEGKPTIASFEKEYFEYERQGKTVQLGYFKVPDRALDESSYLVELATESYRSACSQKKSRKPKTDKRQL